MLVLHNLTSLPTMVRGFFSKVMMREYVTDPQACRDLMLQCSLAVLQAGMMAILPLTILLLPGIESLCILVVCWALLAVLTYPLIEGSRVRVTRIMPDRVGVREVEDVAGEFWIYVNSMMTR